MNFWDWLKPGINIKRWILLGLVGIICISVGLTVLFRIYKSFLEYILASMMVISGSIFLTLAVIYIMKTFIRVINNSGFKVSLDSDKISNLLYEQRILIKGPKIVVIGGGTGISTIIRGLKQYSSNITTVVTVSDDGGGSGLLRNDLGILPPGDIRNCILALADTEPLMKDLLQYRFDEGSLKGQSFGNLFLAAMNGISTNFEDAVRKMSDVLAVRGKVLPVTTENVTLCATLEDGYVIKGESNIGKHNDLHVGKIRNVWLNPDNVEPVGEVLSAIKEADIIILGPGSLYTSVIPNLLIKGVCKAIKESNALKTYICNVMTQPGETDGYRVSEHISAIEDHAYEGIVDYCIVNTQVIPAILEEKYDKDTSKPVKIDENTLTTKGIKLIKGDFVAIENNLIRHNADKLSKVIINLIADKILVKDKKRALDNFFVRNKLKKTLNINEEV